MTDVAKRSLGRTVGLISLATMLSRVLGLVREQLFAGLLGATLRADAFVAAYRIPNLLRDLFAEGALASAFVPTFKATLQNKGRDAAYRLANVIAGNLLVVVGGIVLLGMIFAPDVANLLAGDYAAVPGKLELTATLSRIMFPFLVIVSLSAVAMGMLNAQDRYGAPSLAPAMFNVASIVVGIALAVAGCSPRWVVMGWAMGTVLGGVMQLLVQLPSLWKLGFRPRLGLDLRLRDPAVRRVAAVMAPAIVGVAAVQLNVFINTKFASSEQGAVSWLNYAFRFLQLPIGVFGVAIGTVSTTSYAEAAAVGDLSGMMRHLINGLRMVLFLCVPATVGLLVLAGPIIRLIYQHGHFDIIDSISTSAALRCYAIGLVAYASIKVMAPAFYAMNLARVAVIASLCAVAGNLLSSMTLHQAYGFRVLALGTAIAALLDCIVLYVMFHRRIACITKSAQRELFAHSARVAAAAGMMALVLWSSHALCDRIVGHEHTMARLIEVFAPILLGVASYAVMCALLRVDELTPMLAKVRAKLIR